MKLYVKLLFLVGGCLGQKKTKLMLYSTLVEIEVEVGVELGNFFFIWLENNLKLNLVSNLYEI